MVVVGHGADDVRAAVQSWGLKPEPVFVEQAEQLGTGHAVLEAEQAVGRAQDVIVVGGDFDPVTGDDLKRLVSAHRRNEGAAAIFVTELDEPGGYARVVHERGRLVAIVEGTDAPAALRASKLVSPLIMVFRRADLFRALPAVGRENRTGRVLPERGAPDPHRQGRARVGGSRRHRWDVRRELARRAGRGRARRSATGSTRRTWTTASRSSTRTPRTSTST